MPTQDPFPAAPLFAVPTAVGADPAAGTIVFTDRAGTWRYDGRRGVLGVLTWFNRPVDRHVVAGQMAVAGVDPGLFDTRSGGPLRLLPQEMARPGSQSVSADGLRVAYVTPEKSLRIAFQQPFGNVAGSALARDRLFSSTLISPSGRTIAATGPSFGDTLSPAEALTLGRAAGSTRDVWLVDVQTGSARAVYCTADPCPATLSPGRRSLQPVSWSPDERYLILRDPSLASGVDFNGTPFVALDTDSGALSDLGSAQDFLSWRTWTDVHTLVYVSGLGSEPTKRIRLWSPDLGLRDLTDPSGVAASPSFCVLDSGIYFILGSGSTSHIAVLEADLRTVRQITSDPTYAEDGVRVSDDGKDLLALRRRLSDGQLELWRISRDGGEARALVRLSPPLSSADATRFGSDLYAFDRVVWSR